MEEIMQDFDWEAAVAEIDKACDKSQQSKATNKYCQKTLDAFLTLSQPRPLVQESIHIDGGEGGKRKENVADSDPSAFTTWVYPANIPCREYQLSITKTALFTNTIVALPTGLGKTLIAAVVMYNYFRWFPTGKIVFTAPSRPLVVQQIEACHNVMGIPQEFTIDMTGQMSPPQRAEHWQSLRIFFVTPQVLEKDIQSGVFSNSLFLLYIYCWRLTRNVIATVQEHNCV
jgi:Fanconi anemia group M protein